MKSLLKRIVSVFTREKQKENKNDDVYKFCSTAEGIEDIYCQLEGYSNK
jgi:hypothetical protein